MAVWFMNERQMMGKRSRKQLNKIKDQNQTDRVLNKWLGDNQRKPYPSSFEIMNLVKETGLTKKQVVSAFLCSSRFIFQ